MKVLCIAASLVLTFPYGTAVCGDPPGEVPPAAAPEPLSLFADWVQSIGEDIMLSGRIMNALGVGLPDGSPVKVKQKYLGTNIANRTANIVTVDGRTVILLSRQEPRQGGALEFFLTSRSGVLEKGLRGTDVRVDIAPNSELAQSFEKERQFWAMIVIAETSLLSPLVKLTQKDGKDIKISAVLAKALGLEAASATMKEMSFDDEKTRHTVSVWTNGKRAVIVFLTRLIAEPSERVFLTSYGGKIERSLLGKDGAYSIVPDADLGPSFEAEKAVWLKRVPAPAPAVPVQVPPIR